MTDPTSEQIDPREVERLFHEARERDGADREAFLQRLHGERATLAIAVEALLRAAEAPSVLDRARDLSGFDSDTLGGSEDDADEPRDALDLEGERLGDFLVRRRIGSGGMGTVYLAEQTSPKRRVALKVLTPRAASTSAARRFLLEIETLARLDHPGIARIHGAGEHTIAANPATWFAMELIEDPVPLDEFSVRRGLGLRERLAAFIRVCDAIHHAHRRGFLHRDLKGANLLVPGASRDGLDVKVIDFGVARALGDREEADLDRTRGGELLGTLATMSPEQAAGENDAVDVRSDVYSLGVVLYQLVCERLPYDLAGLGVLEVLRRIREAKPLDARHLDGPFPVDDDLFAVLRRALEKEPELRYDSAAALAEDLGRWLRHEPVRARRASTWHRVRLFTARRRGLAASILAAGVLLVTATVAFVVLHLRMDDALRRYEEADAKLDAQEEVVRTARADLGVLRATLGDLVTGGQAAASLVERSAEDLDETPSLEERRAIVARCYEELRTLDAALGDRPDAMRELAEAYRQLGTLYGNYWTASAEDSRIGALSFEREMDLRRALAAGPGALVADRIALIHAITNYLQGQRKLIDWFGDPKILESERFLSVAAIADEGMALVRQLLLQEPDRLDVLDALVLLLWARSDLLIWAEDLRSAGLADAEEAVEVCEELFASGPQDVQWIERRAMSQFRYGLWLQGWGRREESLEHLELGAEYGLEYAMQIDELLALGESALTSSGAELQVILSSACLELDEQNRPDIALLLNRAALEVLDLQLERLPHPEILWNWSVFAIEVWKRDPSDPDVLDDLRTHWESSDMVGSVSELRPEQWIEACLEAGLFAEPAVAAWLVDEAEEALVAVGSDRLLELTTAMERQAAGENPADS